jgi:leucyl-tRNA synthetase
MKELMSDPELKKLAGKVAKFAQRIVQDINRMPDDMKNRQLKTGILDEAGLIREAEAFFGREFDVKIYAFKEDEENIHDPQRKAGNAKPYRPAIFMI